MCARLMRGRRCASGESRACEGKVFFFLKKKQKTFFDLGRGRFHRHGL
jgi:hypothetical protein